ncbi:WavE lipopolysaccharide synthesis family protein [Pantoea agglomerans]|uniref:WavE lipopolysaccharide synthesis family protein n=1 Tax=Enterobacter agglomerans TaxID=549 RepID=UPI00045D0795|nr:WavE lipopolysaccharide synthesis family protein [Pantoea agglomerans]KDA94790.1 hypothetical protein T296_09260 [Pantoea agglomerans Eh318]
MDFLENTVDENVINRYAFLIQGSMISNGKIDLRVVSYIKKIRSSFPSNTIVISCWSTDCSNQDILLKFCRYFSLNIVFNEDPGTLSADLKGVKYNCNLNRLIVSTRNALLNISEEYVIKLRTDSYFYNDKLKVFLSDYFINSHLELKRQKEYIVFEERVLNCNLFARNPRSYLPYLFHPGDILLIGKKNDLIKLFDVKLAQNDIFQTFTKSYFFTMMKLVPEQYLWVNCIKKVKKIDVYPSNAELSEENIVESEKYYVNNFYVFSSETVGFLWPKHAEHYHNKGKFSIYDENDWMTLYKHHILGIKKVNLGVDRCKSTIVFCMKIYFFVRTNLMKSPFLKRLAIKIFNKRN